MIYPKASTKRYESTIKKTPHQALQEQSKKLRRTIYEIDATMKERFPNKNTEDSLEQELEYCRKLIFGYKTYIAMTEERIITAATITDTNIYYSTIQSTIFNHCQQ